MRKPSRTVSQTRRQKAAASTTPPSPMPGSPKASASAGQQKPAPELADRIARFHQPARRELERMALKNTRFAELTETFPAAAYVIATQQRPLALSRQALKLVEDGAPLREIAACLKIPNWLKRLPPEAFRRALPPLPGSHDFTRRVSTRLPTRHDNAAHWLETLAFANEAAGQDFALWLSHHHAIADDTPPERAFAILAAYAWHSRCAKPPSADLVIPPWQPEMALDTAICAAKIWWNRLRLLMQIDEHTIADPWLEPAETRGFTFHPLQTPQDILAEARQMHNCCDQYAEKLAHHRIRLFAIRKDAIPIATMEIGQHPCEAGVLTITQLKSKHNLPAPSAIWQAAYAWLSCQPDIRRLPPVIASAHQLDKKVWTDLMASYRSQTGGAPWLPDNPNLAGFKRLDDELCKLARRAGIVSWLFS